jgi:hypothetical protein
MYVCVEDTLSSTYLCVDCDIQHYTYVDKLHLCYMHLCVNHVFFKFKILYQNTYEHMDMYFK